MKDNLLTFFDFHYTSCPGNLFIKYYAESVTLAQLAPNCETFIPGSVNPVICSFAAPNYSQIQIITVKIS